MPVSAGSFCKSLVNASRPPADAPIPTMGKDAECAGSFDGMAVRLPAPGVLGFGFAGFFLLLLAIAFYIHWIISPGMWNGGVLGFDRPAWGTPSCVPRRDSSCRVVLAHSDLRMCRWGSRLVSPPTHECGRHPRPES